MNDPRTTAPPHTTAPAGSPFRHRAFTVIWIATVVSNIGGWMYNVASGWLMTSLDPNAFIVSMVQVANSLPMFLFAIPAGALADIVNQRRLLIFGERNDRPLVEILRHVMCRGADHLDSVFERLRIRFGPFEAGQERMMNIDASAGQVGT
jgi:Transmembrane secretion effector